jgi:hypothetical protein
LTALGIVAAMAVAITAGLLLANAGGNSGPTAAQLAAARRAAAERAKVVSTDKQLTSIMQGLAGVENRDLTALNNATTPTAQADAAAAEQRAFTSTAKKVAALVGDSPAATPLHTSLVSTGAAYGRLASAARAGKVRQYDAAAAAIRGDERTLQAEVAKL